MNKKELKKHIERNLPKWFQPIAELALIHNVFVFPYDGGIIVRGALFK